LEIGVGVACRSAVTWPRLVLAWFGLVAVVALSGFGSSAEASVVRVATLLPSQGQTGFSSVAAADGVLVAGGGSATDVFTASRSGWKSSRPAAVLSGTVSSLSTSGKVIVAEAEQSQTLFSPEVFVEPPGGWTGSVSPAGTLVASSSAQLSAPVISGDTIVASGSDGAAYLFTEPPGGWSGAVSETARLVDSDGGHFVQAAIVGRHIFAGGLPPGRVDVFTEPSAGWSGVVHQSGVITNDWLALAISGTDVLGRINPFDRADSDSGLPAVFTAPASGQSGTLRLAARLYQATSVGPQGDSAFSGRVAALSTQAEAGSQNPCPCAAEVTVFTRPAGGWAGALAAPSAINTTETNGLALALDGRTLFVTGGDSVEVYQVTGSEGAAVRAPNTTPARVSGLSAGRPALRFQLDVGTDDPRIAQFELRLPPGLSLTTNASALQKSLGTMQTPGSSLFRASVTNSHGELLVRPLLPMYTSVTVAISSGGLRESRALSRQARRRRQNPSQHHAFVLRAQLRTLDSIGDTKTTAVRFRADA
jgi:hypothetical protein